MRVAFCSHCAFRPGTLALLDEAGIPWEQAVAADSDRAIEVAVSADLAVTAVLEGHEPALYEQIPSAAGLPDLGVRRIVAYAGTGREKIVTPLLDLLRSEFRALPTGRADLAAE